MEPTFAQFVVIAIIAILWAVPMWRLLPRAGLPKWLALLTAVPGIGSMIALVLIWVMAFKTWPGDRPEERVA